MWWSAVRRKQVLIATLGLFSTRAFRTPIAMSSSTTTSSANAVATTGTMPPSVREVGPGFYNIRSKLPMLGGLVDIGVHMSLCRLSSGKYLVLDTISLDDDVVGKENKAFIDRVTEGGKLIEAVVATHPFHTMYFPTFIQKHYPKATYYGTPRHLRKFSDLPWAGSVTDVLNKWEPDVSMRIPAGAEFNDPKPEYNHFSSVLVFHKASRTIHVDDTIMYIEDKAPAVAWLAGYRRFSMSFHPTMEKVGLRGTAEAPLEFIAWVESLLNDWDFDTICTAHIGNKVGGAKEQLRETLEGVKPRLIKMAEQRGAKHDGRGRGSSL